LYLHRVIVRLEKLVKGMGLEGEAEVLGENLARHHFVGLFNLPNPSSRTIALGSTQPLTEMSTRNLPGGKERPARRADNIAAICEPNV
jgi:hypothetical protein